MVCVLCVCVHFYLWGWFQQISETGCSAEDTGYTRHGSITSRQRTYMRCVRFALQLQHSRSEPVASLTWGIQIKHTRLVVQWAGDTHRRTSKTSRPRGSSLSSVPLGGEDTGQKSTSGVQISTWSLLSFIVIILCVCVRVYLCMCAFKCVCV